MVDFVSQRLTGLVFLNFSTRSFLGFAAVRLFDFFCFSQLLSCVLRSLTFGVLVGCCSVPAFDFHNYAVCLLCSYYQHRAAFARL